MTSPLSKTLLLAATGALASSAASAQTVLFSDSFEADSSADYTVVDDGSPDGAADLAFDYIAAGIPLAPRSTAGDTLGVKLTANTTVGQADAITVFHNTPVVEDRYRMTVDAWMNFSGTAGTTEFGKVGVGGDGATFNQVFLPISGSGAFISFSGDGGSSSDFRWFRDPANSPAGDSASTTLPNSHPSYLGNGSNNTGTFFQDLFPSPPSTIAGAPGNIWTTVTVDVDNDAGLISFFFDGALTFRGEFAGRFDGLVSVALADAFSSVGIADSFTVFDNLLVESLPATGASYCAVVPNSTGLEGRLLASGSTAAADNDFSLRAYDIPTDSFGFFLVSPTQAFMPNPGGSNGNLCLGTFGRGVGGAIWNSGVGGTAFLQGDLTAMPSAGGPMAVMPGDTLNFQGWFRDLVGGVRTSNLTNGLSVTFN